MWVVIPALDEESSIGKVLAALPPGRGWSCATTVRAIARPRWPVPEEPSWSASPAAATGRPASRPWTRCVPKGPGPGDLVVFLDADFSDDPTDLDRLLAPLRARRADLVVGSRVLGEAEPGALLPQARWGNWLATRWIHALTGVRFTDLGPFRAIRWEVLESLRMEDRAFGWTVEMQLKAASAGWRCEEVPVRYRRRIGRSKITGTVRGTVLASATILGILFRWAWRRRFRLARGVRSG